jgi:hypothetical protein
MVVSDQLPESLEHIECDHDNRFCMVTAGYGPDGPFVDVTGSASAELDAFPPALRGVIALRRTGGRFGHDPDGEALVLAAWQANRIAAHTPALWAERLRVAAYLLQEIADVHPYNRKSLEKRRGH